MRAFNNISNSIQNYPVQWANFIRSSILCIAAFGSKMTTEQIAALMLVVESGLTVFTHQQIQINNATGLKQ
jgi:hypothetical protein